MKYFVGLATSDVLAISFDIGGGNRAEMFQFQWKTAPPTVDGWYWVSADWRDDAFQVFVDTTHLQSKIIVWVAGSDVWSEIEEFTHWLGPLPVPAPPKDGTE